MGFQKMNGPQSTNYFEPHTTDVTIVNRDGNQEFFDSEKILKTLERVCADCKTVVSINEIYKELLRTIFNGITTREIEKACVLAAAVFIERDPAYDTVATRLLLQHMLREVSGPCKIPLDRDKAYRSMFTEGIAFGVAQNLFDSRLLALDLPYLAAYLQPERDALFSYMGLHTLYERYLLKHGGQLKESPQAFWMRIAMGLALNEENPTQRACEFYEVMSQLHYVPSTPTLFHSGFPVAQLSSCYLTTVNDDLGHIFKCMSDNAQLAKWAGGIGTDWTNIRATGSYIKSIKATSQGVVPYLKVANDIVVAITRSGIRRGGKCAYLEAWHLDFEDFLDLKRNTGDERRRTHDMNTASWIPDLFMKRVIHDGPWTLFSPNEVPDLHDAYGADFEKRYAQYEQQARDGVIKNYREISAKQLWRKILTRIFETGHPWITFKDPCNIRSPQDHAGVIHSSNLCTEITLNTSQTETAVCNLGSINMGRHVINGVLDLGLLKKSIKTAMRMLDNVIDLNFYPTQEARESNMRHRPVGLGMMGFQDSLFKQNISFADQNALDFADQMMEQFSYYAIEASMELAAERGAYGSFKGSKWDRGIFPLDTIDLLEKERGVPVQVNRVQRLDWASLKSRVATHGMRNSNTMAMAPTATIATIAGCYPTIEPIYKNMYVKANVSGEFTIINTYLVDDLKKIGLWHQAMIDLIKYYDGNISAITSIPQEIRHKYTTAFELNAEWLIQITAARGKWIDQSQSHNIFLDTVSGKKLESVYLAAWHCGLKTTYYARTLGASQIEKSTLDAKTFGYTQTREYNAVNNTETTAAKEMESDTLETDNLIACSLIDPSCESCQ